MKDIERYLENLIEWTENGTLSWESYHHNRNNFSIITYGAISNGVKIELEFCFKTVVMMLTKNGKLTNFYLPIELNALAYKLRHAIEVQNISDLKKCIIGKFKIFFGEEDDNDR